MIDRTEDNEIKKVILVANTSWYLQNFRLGLIRELQSRGIEILALAPPDDSSPRFRDLGVRYVSFPMSRRGLNPLTDLQLLANLYSVYRKERPDFVFHNTIKPVIYGSIAARRADVRHVNMIPGLGYVFIGKKFAQRGLRAMVRWLYRFALSRSQKVFFQNPDDQQYFVQHGLVEESRTAVTFGSGVDLEYFSFAEPLNTNGTCTFLLVARMLWDKGVGEFVSAARKVKQTFPAASFQLLGMLDKDNPSHIPEATIAGWTKTGIVEYLGEVADVRPHIQRADVVVLPSYYREGVPKSLLEAMALGRPIITTDAPGCKETVIHGVNGLMIPTRDEQALFDAICAMIVKPEKRLEMGREGRRIAVERFDVKRVNRMILDSMSIP